MKIDNFRLGLQDEVDKIVRYIRIHPSKLWKQFETGGGTIGLSALVVVNTQPIPTCLAYSWTYDLVQDTITSDQPIFPGDARREEEDLLCGEKNQITKYIRTHRQFYRDNNPICAVRKLIELEIQYAPKKVNYPIQIFHFQGVEAQHIMIKDANDEKYRCK